MHPNEVFPVWPRAQLEFERHARERTRTPFVLRRQGFLSAGLAERVTEWFLRPPTEPGDAVRHAYRALAGESAHLFDVVRLHLGVRVRYVDQEPYEDAAALCADLREHASMRLTRDERHPLLGDAFEQLRVVHDVFGHAALGVGFDLQSEFSTWLQCRALFSPVARPAAFCELVGAVTTYITTGEKPGLRAKLPPAELLL